MNAWKLMMIAISYTTRDVLNRLFDQLQKSLGDALKTAKKGGEKLPVQAKLYSKNKIFIRI